MGEKRVELELITPEMAKDWLEKSPRKQDVKDFKTKIYVEAIMKNEWKAGTEKTPIKIKGEDIRNGFHRLNSIVMAGKAAEMLVEREEA